jgi:uncharacterized alkaline shock family protein YloU
MSETKATSTQAGAMSDKTPKSEPAARGGSLERRSGTQLHTDQGNTTIADSVVSKIAGVATREVPGVHDMGKGTARAFGALKEKLPVGSNQPNPAQGVKVEVGELQAAVDLDIVVDYGASIVDVAQSVRRNVVDRVEGMTGLEVVEVNISVDDVWLGDDDEDTHEPRVQ